MKDLIIRNDVGNSICKVSYNEVTEVVDIEINKPINLKINGNLGTEIQGECDFTVHGDMRIDTFLAKLFINSYISKYIEDNPIAIEKQKEIKERTSAYNDWVLKNEDKIIENFKRFISEQKELL